MSTAAATLRRARRAADLTQVQLARRMHTSQSVVARLEREGANPTVDTLAAAMRATGHRLELRVARAPVPLDSDQLLERLAMTPAERLAAFAASHRRQRRLSARARRVAR